MDRKIVDIDAELERDGKIQKVKLRFLLKPITAESGTVLVRYLIDRFLEFAPDPRIEDGNYTLRYVCSSPVGVLHLSAWTPELA